MAVEQTGEQEAGARLVVGLDVPLGRVEGLLGRRLIDPGLEPVDDAGAGRLTGIGPGVLLEQDLGVDQPGPVVPRALEPGDVALDLPQHREPGVHRVGVVGPEDRVHLRGQLQVPPVVIVLGQVQRRLLGQLRPGQTLLHADDQFLAGQAGVLDPHAQEPPAQPVEVGHADLVLAPHRPGVVRRGREVTDDDLVVAQGVVLAVRGQAGLGPQEVRLGQVRIAGPPVLIEPVAQTPGRLVRPALGQQFAGLPHDVGVCPRLRGGGLGPAAVVLERELGGLGQGGGGQKEDREQAERSDHAGRIADRAPRSRLSLCDAGEIRYPPSHSKQGRTAHAGRADRPRRTPDPRGRRGDLRA